MKGASSASPPFLPSILAISFGRGSSLTDLRLCCSLSLHPDYSYFRTTLKRSLKLLDQPTLSTTGNKSIDAALEVLQTERKTVAEKEEDGDEVGDNIKASATDQDENMVEAAQPQAPAEDTREEKAIKDALEILVRNATQEFGFAPRDVYEGVFDPLSAKHKHAEKVDGLDYSHLKSIAEAFIKRYELDGNSHRVVAVQPKEGAPKYDEWKIDFKSTGIKMRVMEAMQVVEDRHLRETLKLLNGINGASGLAGTVFEVIVHRILSHGWQDTNSMPQPTRMMVADKSKPLALSTKSSTPGTSLPPCALLRAESRTPTRVAFNREFSGVVLDGNIYYTPTSATQPLFDSFIVDFVEPNTAVISVLHITISPRHGGLAQGYKDIRKLMKHARKLLEERLEEERLKKKRLEEELPEQEPLKQEPPKTRSGQDPPSTTVKVVYFLVCSDDDGSQLRQWNMPVGWDDEIKENDHRGEVYCIRIPTSVLPGMSCAFDPNFAPY